METLQGNPLDSLYALTESIRFLFDVHIGKKRVFSKYVIPRLTGKHVLDFGCGVGFYTREYALVAGSVIGVDSSPASLEMARSANSGENITHISLDYFLAGKEMFDVVVCADSLELNPDWEHYMEILWNRLNDGGEVCISAPNFNMRKNRLMHLLLRIEGMLLRLTHPSQRDAARIVADLERGKWDGAYYRNFNTELEDWFYRKGVRYEKRYFFMGNRIQFNSPSENHVLYTARK